MVEMGNRSQGGHMEGFRYFGLRQDAVVLNSSSQKHVLAARIHHCFVTLRLMDTGPGEYKASLVKVEELLPVMWAAAHLLLMALT